MHAEQGGPDGLRPYLAKRHVLALSLGTSLGWGSLVVTSNTYLAQAGPMGTMLGILAGMAIMLLICHNYQYLMESFPEAGGAYTYVCDVYGHDRGFLVAWFLALTYLAVLWANITSLPLFARFFLGGIFHFGQLYTIFGYQVYLGEALLSIAGLLGAAGLCIVWKKGVARLMTALVAVFSLGILCCFVAAMVMRDRPLAPAFVPDSSAISQIVMIAVMSPWAFIGFENITHGAEEFTFRREKARSILIASVLITALLYIAVSLLSVTAYPPEYTSWRAYIADLGNLSGIKALPAFYAARHYLGDTGVYIMMASLLALVLTSLIGNILALSRLFYALAKDDVIPRPFARVNRHGTPHMAILLVVGISVLVPFVGRTAIGWIVDVTTFCATMVYGFVSAAASKRGAFSKDRGATITGRLGLLLMVAFGAYLVIPCFFTEASMETETYFLFAVWAILGMLYFHFVLRKDKHNRFGYAIIVWIALLSLILFISLVWMSQYSMRAASQGLSAIQQYYADAGVGTDGQAFLQQVLRGIRLSEGGSILVVVLLFAFSLAVMVNNYSTMSRRAEKSEAHVSLLQCIANTDPLTGVKSKHAYLEFEAQMNHRIQEKSAEPFAVLVCDVNGLKHINDTLGHQAGDAYLQEACRLICEHFKHSPVFRTGGDEFVVVLQGQAFQNRQESTAGINRQVEANIAANKAVVSVGEAEYVPGEDANVHSVFQRADERMYARKSELKSMGAVTRG